MWGVRVFQIIFFLTRKKGQIIGNYSPTHGLYIATIRGWNTKKKKLNTKKKKAAGTSPVPFSASLSFLLVSVRIEHASSQLAPQPTALPPSSHSASFFG